MTQSKANIAAMFKEAWSDDDFRFDIKAQEVATNLARALHDAGMNRTQLSEKLGWRPSRVSKVLGGEANLTLKTLYQICDAMNLEFDVVLRTPNQAPAAQPWEASHLENDIRRLHDEVQHTHARAQAMLETARLLSRNSWQRASYINHMVSSGNVYTELQTGCGAH